MSEDVENICERIPVSNSLPRSSPEMEDEDDERESGPRLGFLAFCRCLGQLLLPYKLRFSAVFCAMLISVAISAALPLSIKVIADYGLRSPPNFKLLLAILITILCAGAMGSATFLVWDIFYARIGANLLNDLRFNMYRHLQQLSMSYYAKVQAGDIAARFLADFAAVENFIILSFPFALNSALFLVISMAILLVIQWKMALFAMCGLVVSLRFGHWIEPRASMATRNAKRAQADIAAVLHENIQAQPVIKLFRLHGLMTENFRRLGIRFRDTSARSNFLLYMTELVPSHSIMLIGLATLCVGAVFVFHGLLTIGDLVAFQLILNEVTVNVSEFTWSIPSYVQASVSMQRINELLTERPEVVDQPDAAPLPRPVSEIALNRVSFGYVSGHMNLSEVNLTIPVNQSVLFVGQSGCGKSTVLNLLMRFYDPINGSVTVDGRDIRNVTQDSLRSHMSVVLQESFLFNTSIRENIRMGKSGATDADVEAAARTAEIHDIIMGMPDGYNTMVGERGSSLSGGQRQRVAIARAIISDPAVLLLDEATASLDHATADSINASLARISQGRTMISVTHRLEMGPLVDRIFVFKEGRLVDQGRHDELLESGGLYAELWAKQTGFHIAGDGSAEVAPARLREIPLLTTLDDASREALAELFVTERMPKDRVVVEFGEPGDKFYIIVRGRAAVSKPDSDGAERCVGVLESGDHFGEIALVNKSPRTATVRTVTDCVFLTLSSVHFLRMLKENPRMHAAIDEVMRTRAAS